MAPFETAVTHVRQLIKPKLTVIVNDGEPEFRIHKFLSNLEFFCNAPESKIKTQYKPNKSGKIQFEHF